MSQGLEQTWRWYGPDDPVTLKDIRQAGATGIVTALHHIPIGEVWTPEEIAIRRSTIEAAGLQWSVVESLAIHEEIKTAGPKRDHLLENYRISMRNLASAGIQRICYNFMPALDWTRTHLNAPFGDGSTALSFDLVTFAVFDMLILQRPGAEDDYPESVRQEAAAKMVTMTESELLELEQTCIAGLPGANQGFGMAEFRSAIAKYEGMDAERYREHVRYFLNAIMPTAIEWDVKMAVHPDDPPFDILGLPRIVSSREDIRAYFDLYDHPNNGLTLCTGSLGSNPQNNCVSIADHFLDRIHFVHLRNVTNYDEKSFIEDNHLEGEVDMFEIMRVLLRSKTASLPYRPDHGHRMLFELGRTVNPGYSAIGRLRGLAELRGLELGIARSMS